MRTQYIMVDFENVCPKAIQPFDREHHRIFIFLGPQQTRLPFEIAKALQPLGDRVEYIQLNRGGSNALDFIIAFHIGRLAQQDPNGYFHIISKDAGFDPLIQHLQERKILVRRSADIPASIQASTKVTTPLERLYLISTCLKTSPGKPATLKSLHNYINARFSKTLTPEEVQQIVTALISKKVLCIEAEKVTYPPAPKRAEKPNL